MRRNIWGCFFTVQLCVSPLLLSGQETENRVGLADKFKQDYHITLFSTVPMPEVNYLPDLILAESKDVILNYLKVNHHIEYLYYNPFVVILYMATTQNTASSGETAPREQFRVTGRLLDAVTGKPLPGTIMVNEENVLVNADSDGNFSLSLPRGSFAVKAIGPGTVASNLELTVDGNIAIEIELFEKTVELEEVTISTAHPDVNVVSVQPGASTLEVSDLKKIPAFLGEIDISRAVISLPGVSTVGEGSTGFNVRGGSIDQNLILMDGMPLFNSAHLLGFFSIFNPDLLSDFTLYKGLIPVDRGGRASSVLSVKQRGPNKESLGLNTSVGPLNSKIFLDLPLVKGSTGLVIGARGAYPNYVLRSFPDESIVSDSRAGYFDLTVKLDHEFENGSALGSDFYLSGDEFNLSRDTTFNYSTLLAGINYTTRIENRWTLDLSASLSKYRASIIDQSVNQQSQFSNGITQTSMTGKLFTGEDNSGYQVGFEANYYHFFTGKIAPDAGQSEVDYRELPNRQAADLSIFAGAWLSLNDRLSMRAGLRVTSFFNMGPDLIPVFESGAAKEPENVTDTIRLNSGDLDYLKTSLEPRIAITYLAGPSTSVKAGYSRTYQYIHLFSNTVASLPTDLWRPSDPNLLPVSAHIISLGIFKNFRQNLFESSVELFYKDISNAIDFESGTNVLLNPQLVFRTLQGNSEAYGLELSVNKTRGMFTGSLGYTFSRARSQFQSEDVQENLNRGAWFPANFDRPHDLNLLGSWTPGRRWSFSANFAYTTGRPISLPESSYRVGGAIVFGDINRNTFRVPDFHRLDLAVTLAGNNRKDRKFSTSWTFSIYNVYGRKNVFSVFINGEDGKPRQLSVLGAPFPSLTFNLSLN